LAQGLSVPVLTRTWQLLLKGLEEVQRAPAPLAAAEMVLIRLAFASELPDPGELVRRLKAGGAPSSGAAVPEARPDTRPTPHMEAPRVEASRVESRGVDAPTPGVPGGRDPGPAAGHRQGEPSAGLARALPSQSAPSALAPSPKDFSAVVELVAGQREIGLAEHLRRDVHLVSFQPGRIEINPREEAPRDLAGRVGRLLGDWTGERWVVSVSDLPGRPTLADQEADQQAQKLEAVRRHPLVQAALETFPGAEIRSIRDGEEPLAEAARNGEAEESLEAGDAGDDEPEERT